MTDSGGTDAPDTEGEKVPSLEERLTRLEEIVRSLEAAELKVEELLGPEEESAIRVLEEESE